MCTYSLLLRMNNGGLTRVEASLLVCSARSSVSAVLSSVNHVSLCLVLKFRAARHGPGPRRHGPVKAGLARHGNSCELCRASLLPEPAAHDTAHQL
jgi:hypothetical protein